jgi:hypothetical protein
MKSFKRLPTIPNVAKGNGVAITLPVGNNYENVVLYHKGVTPKQMTNIRLEIDGRMVSEWADGERLASLDAHYNRSSTAGALTFHFNRPELHLLGERRFFGLDTMGFQTATIRFDIASDAAAPELEAYAEVTQSIAGVPNYLTKVRRFFIPVSSVGKFEIDNIPKPAGASIAAFHLYMPDTTDDADALASVIKAELLVDNVNWHDVDAVKAADRQVSNGRDPQVNESTVIDLIQDGDIRHALVLNNTIQDMRLRCESSAVGQVELVVEYIDLHGPGRF